MLGSVKNTFPASFTFVCNKSNKKRCVNLTSKHMFNKNVWLAKKFHGMSY